MIIIKKTYLMKKSRIGGGAISDKREKVRLNFKTHADNPT